MLDILQEEAVDVMAVMRRETSLAEASKLETEDEQTLSEETDVTTDIG